jgi:hypothetical protein
MGISRTVASKPLIYEYNEVQHINSAKLPWKRDFLTVQGDFGKIIDVVRKKLCCLRV